ncbi:MAG: serine dehydratase, partial [Marinilabiliales bacterium]
RFIEESGIKISVSYNPLEIKHPNAYKLNLRNNSEQHELMAVSTGGGMLEVLSIDNEKTSFIGDCYVTLFFLKANTDCSKLISHIENAGIQIKDKNSKFISIASFERADDEFLNKIKAFTEVDYIRFLEPVLPILSAKDFNIPFRSASEMLQYNKNKNLQLWLLALRYESARCNITEDKVFKMMESIVEILSKSIEHGKNGTKYADRILHDQSVKFAKMETNRTLLGSGLHNQIIHYVSVLMEVKSSMGIIVAAPTAGSCGVMPGAVFATSHYLGMSNADIVKAMLTAGIIGVLVAEKSTFSAEVAGCMAECGVGSGMAAAALCQLGGGTVEQCLGAASFALQNTMGMVCDPIAARVEAPCIGKNVMTALNALACANMAIADYNHLIPLDEVIEAFDQVGRSLPREVRCTALGGLSVTPAAIKIDKKIN